MDDKLLNAKAVSEKLSVHLMTVYALAKAGSLSFVRIGNRNIRFRESDVNSWISSNRSGSRNLK